VKVGLWNPVEYAAEGLPRGWPAPPRHWTPERGAESLRRAFELYDVAAEAGFDVLSVAEHHYGFGSLTPSPALFAAALAQRYPGQTIGVLGPILPLANPIRVAEEIAMVDLLAGGRTVVGFFRGIPNEHLVYGTPPEATGEMFREAFALVLRAWTEPETFGWEGRHYRFRTVSPWPRPLQQPHPPIVSGVTSPEAAVWVAAQGYWPGLFGAVVPPERAAACVEAWRAGVEARGETPDDEQVVYRARIYVAPSDEEAEADVARLRLGDARAVVAPAPERAASAARVMAALSGGGPPRGAGGPPKEPRPEFVGSPETVAEQIRASRATIGWGFLDAVFADPNLPHERALRSLRLFVNDVLPTMRNGR
jgi:alkanesulfonate monooxygenase SsuD/methylene tetrahydromethanopterin reductase-like flavin-dependent oxidoreductase (luciferase family)